MRALDLSFAPGEAANETELHELLSVLDSVDWTTVPPEWSFRGTLDGDASVGRSGPAGDFVYFDPWGRTRITAEAAADMKRDVRVAPAGQVYGYVHESWDERENEGVGSPDVMQYDDAHAGDERGEDGYGSGSNVATNAQMRSDRDFAACFLRDAGCESDELEGSWDELAAYVRGILRASARNSVSSRTRSRTRSRH